MKVSSNLCLSAILSSVHTSLFPHSVPILIKAKTTQHDEVTEYQHISIDFRDKEPIPIQGYTPILKDHLVHY